MRTLEPATDPFAEARAPRHRLELPVLGARFRFESDSRGLLSYARAAYAGLPSYRFAGAGRPCVVRLVLGEEISAGRRARSEPPSLQPFGGGALIGGVVAGGSVVTVDVATRSAVVVIAPELLRFPYHVRYELLEFAVYCLATRVQRLVPLHAACVGGGGAAALLLGASGAGKSTLMLHALGAGLEFVAEDSVLVRPRGLLATGVANFLHLRTDSRQLAGGSPLGTRVRQSTVIRRRSGVRKYELDLRHGGLRLARAPLPLRVLVFLSAQHSAGELLRAVPAAVALRRLRAEQRYAVGQPGWDEFEQRAGLLPAFELRRGLTPADGVETLRGLLQRYRKPARAARR